MKKKRREAANGVYARCVGEREGKDSSRNGLTDDLNVFSRGVASPAWAKMLASRRMTGRELGGLRSIRRMTAAPALLGNVAFSFGVVRTHGRIAPALYRSCGLMPCGNPSGLPSPNARSANPHGVALLLAERGGFRQFALGASHE